MKALLEKAWRESFRLRYGVDYTVSDAAEDAKAIATIGQQAEKRNWTLHAAIRFFNTALDMIESDPYWKNRIGLHAVARNINGVYALARRRTAEDKARGDFDPEEFRKEAEKPNPKETAKREMEKIRQIIGAKNVQEDAGENVQEEAGEAGCPGDKT